ncbi:MAG: flippase [Dehalococcoidia bacterium]|nr:flippase [Dehalococcoidia bacterium]
MSAVRRIAQNTVILISTQVLVAVFGLIFGTFAARHLGPDSFGILTFALSLTQLASLLFGSGLAPLSLREVAANQSAAPRYLANGGVLRMGMAAISLLLVTLYAWLMGYPSETVLVVVLLALALAFKATTEIPYSIFRAFEMMQYIAVGQIMSSLLLLVGLGFALVYDFNVVGFAWLYVAANGLALIYVAAMLIWRFFLSHHPPHISRGQVMIDIPSMRVIRAAAFPFAVATVGMASLHYADSVMISAMVSNSDALVGWYNAAYRLVDMLAALRAASAISITPVLVQAYTTSREMLTFICERLFKYYVILALPIGVGTTLLAERFIRTVYGRQYMDSTIALQILIWVFVIGSANIFPMLFQAIQRARTAAVVIVVSAILNLLLNLVLIPRYDYVAAAATTLACACFAFIVLSVLYARTDYYFGLPSVIKLLSRVIPATAAMGLMVWYLPQWHLGVTVPLAAVIYFIVLALLRTFDAGDFRLLVSLVSNQPLAPLIGSGKEEGGPSGD